MAEKFDSEINRLLADTEDGARAKPRLRARLAADLAEGLAGAAGTGDDLAAKSAFLEGRLTGPEREAFAAQLANDENLRADMESARALVDSVAAAPSPVPAHLLQKVLVQAASTPARAPAERRPWFVWLPQGSRAVWAAAAVAAMLVLVPGAILLTGGQLGWWGEEEQLSTSPGPDIEPPKCPDTAEQQVQKDAQSQEPAAEHTDARAPDTPPDCPPPHDKDSPAEAPTR